MKKITRYLLIFLFVCPVLAEITQINNLSQNIILSNNDSHPQDSNKIIYLNSHEERLRWIRGSLNANDSLYSTEISWENYYTSTPNEIDSVKKWAAQFSIVDADYEIKNLVQSFGRQFYNIPHDTLAERLYQEIYDFYAKFPIPPIERWQYAIYINSKKILAPHDSLLYKTVWEQQSIFLDISFFYFDCCTMNEEPLFLNFMEDVEALKHSLNKDSSDVIDSVNIFNVFNTYNRISSRLTQKAQNEALYLLTIKLYQMRNNRYTPELLGQIEKNIWNDYTNFDDSQKAFWHLAVAKMLASIGFSNNSQRIYGNLKRAESLLNDKKHRILYRKFELIKASFWNAMSGMTAKSSSYKSLAFNYKYLNESANERIEYIASLTRYASEWAMDASIRNTKISPVQFVQQANLANIAYKFHYNYNKGNFAGGGQINALISASHYYYLKRKWLKRRLIDYALLAEIIEHNQLLALNMGLENIVIDEANIGDTSNTRKWFNYTFGGNLPIPIPRHYTLWSKNEQQFFSDAVIQTPVSAFSELGIENGSGYWVYSDIRNQFKYLANIEAQNSQWERAFIILSKRDSIGEGQESTDYYFDMGAISGYQIENVITGKLAYKNNNFIIDNKRLANEIQEKKSEIARLDDSIKINNILLKKAKDSIGEITYLNTQLKILNDTLEKAKADLKLKNEKLEESNTILIVMANLLCIFLGISIWLYIVARKKRKEAEESETKSDMYARTMYQLGHHGPKIIDKILKFFDKATELKLEDYKAVCTDKLEKLSSLLGNIYDSADRTHLTFQEEYDLISHYVDLVYSKYDRPDIIPSDLVVDENNYIIKDHLLKEYGTAKMPHFVLLNIIQNAFQYGSVIRSTTGKVIVSIQEVNNYYIFNIENDIFNEAEATKSKSTGIDFIKKAIRYWNKSKKDFFHPDIKFGVYRTIYKIKKYNGEKI